MCHGTEYTIRWAEIVNDGEAHANTCLDTATIDIEHGAPFSYLHHEIGHANWHQTGFDKILEMFVPDPKHRNFIEETFMWGTLPAIISSVREVGDG